MLLHREAKFLLAARASQSICRWCRAESKGTKIYRCADRTETYSSSNYNRIQTSSIVVTITLSTP